MRRPIVVTGGTLLSGLADCRPERLDLRIEGDRITRIGRSPGDSRAATLDATGLIVAPGFIDAHAHSDTTAFLDPTAEGRVAEGVTSEISGMCGFSLFPLTGPTGAARRAALRQPGFSPDWSSAAEYFGRLDACGGAVNRAFFVGHGALRTSVVGFGGRAATARDIVRMQNLLAQCLDQGALGLSTGLIYSPGCFARPREIRALCRVLAEYGRPYVTHMRSEGPRLMAALRETLAYGQSTGAPVHISHLKVAGRSNWWKFDLMRDFLERARAEGVDFTADRYPYIASQTSLDTLFPERLLDGGRAKALERLRSPRLRKRVLADMLGRNRRKDTWDHIRIARAGGGLSRFEGLTLRQVGERLNRSPHEAVFELLIRSRLDVEAIFFKMSEAHLEQALQWPFVCVGSDSSARALRGPTAVGKPHPRTFGTFGRYLGEYVLTRKLLPLPRAIERITRFPAERFGLKDRGVLKEGAFADIVVFDPETYRDCATYENPWRLTAGVRHVLVNGVPVLRNGKRTRALPGKALRRG